MAKEAYDKVKTLELAREALKKYERAGKLHSIMMSEYEYDEEGFPS